MHDYFGKNLFIFNNIEEHIKKVINSYNFKEIKFPILEETSIYRKLIGEHTNLIKKEMYSFYNHNGKSISLRPEGTISCVRAYIEGKLFLNNFLQKLWYIGPMFRYENPQKGRFRQFQQFGLEILGSNDINIDLELILIIKRLWQEFDILNNLELKINFLGSLKDRNKYIKDLIFFLNKQGFFKKNYININNPIRLLNSKNEKIVNILKNFPKINEYLNKESLKKFRILCNKLNLFKINFTIDYNLLRGLDYYNDFVFEWISKDLNFTVCAGGRYDQLARNLSNFNLPGVGCAIGIERLSIILNFYKKNFFLIDNSIIDVYIISFKNDNAKTLSIKLTEDLINLKIKNIRVYNDQGYYKNISKKILSILKLNVHLLVIIGEREIKEKFITIKDLLLNKQNKVSYNEVIKFIKNILD